MGEKGEQAETSRISRCEKADHGEAGVEYSSDGWGSWWLPLLLRWCC